MCRQRGVVATPAHHSCGCRWLVAEPVAGYRSRPRARTGPELILRRIFVRRIFFRRPSCSFRPKGQLAAESPRQADAEGEITATSQWCEGQFYRKCDGRPAGAPCRISITGRGADVTHGKAMEQGRKPAALGGRATWHLARTARRSAAPHQARCRTKPERSCYHLG